MPEQIPSSAPPSPSAPPGSPPQAPFGSSPATGPTPNRGFEMAGRQKMGLVLKQLEILLPMFGSGSPEGTDVMKAITLLNKHVQPGTNSPASESNQLQKMQLQNQQSAQQVASMRPQAPKPMAA